jgi:hypothetical protein
MLKKRLKVSLIYCKGCHWECCTLHYWVQSLLKNEMVVHQDFILYVSRRNTYTNVQNITSLPLLINKRSRGKYSLMTGHAYLHQEVQSLCGYDASEPSGEVMSNYDYRDSNQTRVKERNHMDMVAGIALLWLASLADEHIQSPPRFPVHTYKWHPLQPCMINFPDNLSSY